MQAQIIAHRSVVLGVAVSVLAAIAAGAVMLCCVGPVHASPPSPAHTGGMACGSRDMPDANVVVVPQNRTGAPDVVASLDAVSYQLASPERFEVTSSPGVPSIAADPLCGRLLL
jgi:hypothetical protein